MDTNTDDVLESIAAWKPGETDFVVLTASDYDYLVKAARAACRRNLGGRDLSDLDDIYSAPLTLVFAS